jgi:DNA-damage-inducible protein D
MSEKLDKKGLPTPSKIPMSEVVKLAAPLLGKPDDPGQGPPLEEGMVQLVLFSGFSIRQVFHNNEWYFSIVDVVGAIAGTENPRRFWSDLKRKLHEEEGFDELYEKIVQLKMQASDGKWYLTDTVNAENLLRIVQSISSKKAEPFNRWLAKVGYERIQETHDPEIAVKRAILTWQVQGRTPDWIEARPRAIVVRKDLRDHMTDLELIFTMLGEKSTTEIAKATNAQGFVRNATAAKAGGRGPVMREGARATDGGRLCGIAV